MTLRYRVIAWKSPSVERWGPLELVYEDPAYGLRRFRIKSRSAFRTVKGSSLEEVTAEIAREEGQAGQMEISPICNYSGDFNSIRPEVLLRDFETKMAMKHGATDQANAAFMQYH